MRHKQLDILRTHCTILTLETSIERSGQIQLNDAKPNTRKYTIWPSDGDEGHVFWLKAIYPFPQNPFLNVNAMFSCKIRPRHWIFCLWWFYAIKLNFEDQNNKRKTNFGCKRKSGSLFMIAHCRVEFSHRGIWFGLLESVDYQLSYNVQVGPI